MNYKNIPVITGLTASLALSAVVLSNVPDAMAAGFSGSYAPSNFTLTNTNANGSVDTSNAPASITLTGGNSASNDFGNTDYVTTAAASGLVSYDWNFITFDNPGFNSFISLLNGTGSQLADTNGQTGSFSFSVNAGDTFGFRIATISNVFGLVQVTISNFNAPTGSVPVPVPEPSSLLGLSAIAALGLGSGLKRRSKKST